MDREGVKESMPSSYQGKALAMIRQAHCYLRAAEDACKEEKYQFACMAVSDSRHWSNRAMHHLQKRGDPALGLAEAGL